MKFVKLNKEALEAARQKRVPVDDVLGVKGGASVAGSTFWKAQRTCPRMAALKTAGLRREGASSESLDSGLLYHACLEAYYRAIQAHQLELSGNLAALSSDKLMPSRLEAHAWAVLEKFRALEGYAETVEVIERILGAYFQAYRGEDRWEIVAVEENLEWLEDFVPKGEIGRLCYSARLDLLVLDHKLGGLWVIEHKTAQSVSEKALAGFQMDLQTLGNVWLMHACVDLDQFDAVFAGINVNIITKATQPKIARVQVCPSPQHLAEFEHSMRAMSRIATVTQELGSPRYIGNCAGPAQYFSSCDFFDVCHMRPMDSLADTIAAEPPLGFTWKGRT